MDKKVLFFIVSAVISIVVLLFTVSCAKEDKNPSSMTSHDEYSTMPMAGGNTGEITQKICPVMGKPVSKDIYTDHNGQRIYFCCTGCPETFKSNPEKYLKKLESGTEPETSSAYKPNTLCPVMEGKPVRKDLYVDYNGRRVYFCCGGCIRAFKENPEKYMKNL